MAGLICDSRALQSIHTHLFATHSYSFAWQCERHQRDIDTRQMSRAAARLQAGERRAHAGVGRGRGGHSLALRAALPRLHAVPAGAQLPASIPSDVAIRAAAMNYLEFMRQCDPPFGRSAARDSLPCADCEGGAESPVRSAASAPSAVTAACLEFCHWHGRIRHGQTKEAAATEPLIYKSDIMA